MVLHFELLPVAPVPTQNHHTAGSELGVWSLQEEWVAKAEAALASGAGSEKQKQTIRDKILICQLKLDVPQQTAVTNTLEHAR